MIIDLILDRKAGDPYDPQLFADEVRDYAEVFPDLSPIIEAIGTQCEQRVKHELCAYVLENDYAPEICDYINSVTWLPDWWEMN